MISLKSSVDKIVQCYIDIGYKACTDAFFKPGKRCCPVSAIYMKNNGVLNTSLNIDKRVNIVYNNLSFTNYYSGFLRGFDSTNPSTIKSERREYIKGVNKGIAVKKKLIDLGLLKT